MATLQFATTSNVKFVAALEICHEHHIELTQVALDLLEIQSDNGEAIARHKAMAAFKELRIPLVVSDDSWIIPGLKGFPGPYMKYVNEWFTPADFLRLTVDLEDRQIILRQEVVYQDATQQKAFTADIPCRLLKAIRGDSEYPHLTLTSIDGRHSFAEIIAAGGSGLAGTRSVWHELCEWLDARSGRK